MEYEIIIGMEVHAELATKTKMFCSCLNAPFESEPNTNVCPLCLGLPGTLPVMNKQAVEWTVDLGYDLGATIATFTKWDRKNYFYPDLPKGYQISQYDFPLLSGGVLEFRLGDEVKTVRVTRVHLEEDTGKLVHASTTSQESLRATSKESPASFVDFNRAGVPLLELVTEPEIHSAEEAKKFCKTYQFILQRRGIARADMEKGEMRCEANISVRPIGQQEFGTKVEVKNLNSFRSVERAIVYEAKRQIAALGAGEAIVQETRGWDEAKQQTYTQRRKETAADYRYFPEPDLPPVTPDALWDLAAKSRDSFGYPHLEAKAMHHELGIAADVADFFTSNSEAFAYWTELREELAEPTKVQKQQLQMAASVYTNTDTARQLNPTQLVELAGLVVAGTISHLQVRRVIDTVVAQGLEPTEVVDKLDLKQVSNEGELEVIIDGVLASNQDAVTKYQAGEQQVYGYLVGQVMRATKGKANPETVNKILKEKLV